MIEFELDGVTVPIESLGDYQQGYRQKTPFITHQMGDGGSNRQGLAGAVGKLRITLAGRGWIPAGLAGLDYLAPMTFKSGLARGITSASNIIDIPAARRSDAGFLPYGYAIVDGAAVETSVNVVGNTATLTAVTGAGGYQVNFYPAFQVYAALTSEGVDAGAGNFSWSLECEEI